MTLTLELAPEVEARLEAEAAKQGISEQDYALSLIKQGLSPIVQDLNEEAIVPGRLIGPELVAYLEKEGVIGMWADRDDIGDSLEYARKLRKQAETRNWD